ncbi:putative chromosome-partitioning protein ParB [Thalassoglobus neptunius]|uniref:Putative chromosome-partitioning protein ParB n=1 Tax=Thalassoglobus neptunius TaxID=1938619 RepID=A0A5C5X560_9PLAN|nr:ParB/RepB/Spo0J family partition protein [Thalassoglobus neptunius]TWT58050.1 putative chromosome-partitioning protein ParB [Thalassoglobus neptunius]
MSEHQQPQGNRRLGRGLSALLGNNAPSGVEQAEGEQLAGELTQVSIDRVVRNPFQPRKQFDQESLGELASSIKEHGVIQPVIVREFEGSYQLIAGERRWQAAKRAGLTQIPCRVLDVIDKTACEFALEENLKRKDLNDLEKAQAFRDYLDQFECTIEELAKQLSMSRSAISNMLRLLELPDPVKNALHSERITAGHARALLSLDEPQQLELCGRIQSEKLSVRNTEAAVKEALKKPASEVSQPESSDGEQATIPISKGDAERTNHMTSLESRLRDLLGVKVSIKLSGKDSGTIQIPFSSTQEFERLLKTMRRSAA